MSKEIKIPQKPERKNIDKYLEDFVSGKSKSKDQKDILSRTTLILPKDIHKKLKLKSVELSTPVNNIILESIKEFLKEKD